MKLKFLTLIVALLALGCTNDDRVVNPGKTELAFASNALVLNEADQALVVTVTFDKPAQADGEVEVSFDGTATNPEHYIVLPELVGGILILEFEKGDEEVQFLILPINDDENTGNKSVSAELSNPSEGFELGHQKALVVSIADDDINPGETISINFQSGSNSIDENSEHGIKIGLELSNPTHFQEVVEVGVGIPANLQYGVHFYTVPAMVDGVIPIVFDAGQVSQSFMFFPINNSVLSEDVEFIFTISNWSAWLSPGQQYDTRLSLIDDEE